MANVESIFNEIKFECRPTKNESFFVDLFESFFGTGAKKRSNFIGGQNDNKNTLHENLFDVMFPGLKKQVVFGTGKGGYEKYLSKKYTVDFFDEEKKTIFEIDGKSHKTERGILKDKIRDYFFWHELGIKTIRFTNEEVEEMLLNHLKKMNETGELDELYATAQKL